MREITPVRLTLLSGETKFRRVKSFDHAELCRAFELDPATYHFDLPRAAYRDDLSKSGVTGYVLRGDNVRPVGTLHVALEDEKFRDLDPDRDRLDLKQTNRN